MTRSISETIENMSSRTHKPTNLSHHLAAAMLFAFLMAFFRVLYNCVNFLDDNTNHRIVLIVKNNYVA